MIRRQRCVALLLTLAAAALAQSPTPEECYSDELCVPIVECLQYRTREDILASRPVICGFDGLDSFVCCRADDLNITLPATEEVPSVAEHLSPVERGPSPETEIPVSASPAPVAATAQSPAAQPDTPAEPSSTGSAVDASLEPADIGCGLANVASSEDELLCSVLPGSPQCSGAPGRWPWLALVGRITAAGPGEWFCGGTLLSAEYVLTAAHCVDPQHATSAAIRLGSAPLSVAGASSTFQIRGVTRVTPHPQFGGGSHNDLALLRLDQPAALGIYVSPVCLPVRPPSDGADRLTVATTLTITGFGVRFPGQFPDTALTADLRVTDHLACERAHAASPLFSDRFPQGFTGAEVCAHGTEGSDELRRVCPGDPGGPLVTSADPVTGRHQLAALLSTGIACNSTVLPEVYTSLSPYVDWILDTISG